MWIGLELTYLLLLRASEIFAEENGVFHELYCLGRGDVAFSGGGSSWEEKENKRRTKWKSGSEGRNGTKEENERYW